MLADLQDPVKTALPVEDADPVILGEADHAAGEDVPVGQPDPGHLQPAQWKTINRPKDQVFHSFIHTSFIKEDRDRQ